MEIARAVYISFLQLSRQKTCSAIIFGGDMKKYLWLLLTPIWLWAQATVSLDRYLEWSRQNQHLTAADLQSRYPIAVPPFKLSGDGFAISQFAFLDSVMIKYALTPDELALLRQNRFMASERMGYDGVDLAIRDIFKKDLPLFVSTDMMLDALHRSYKNILTTVERGIDKSLDTTLSRLYDSFPELYARYKDNPAMIACLQDIDLYITTALRLKRIPIEEAGNNSFLADLAPHVVSQNVADDLFRLIRAEQLVEMPLFSEKTRLLDFSQFTPRGNYIERPEYFRTMMWLGIIDFLLVPPAIHRSDPEWVRDTKRMCIDAVLLHQLIDLANVRRLLRSMDAQLAYLVGECDNLDVDELAHLLTLTGIQNGAELLQENRIAQFQQALCSEPAFQQKILAIFFAEDAPDTGVMGDVPIAFKLLGQRYVVDSYVFSQVVYPHIVYQNKAIWRPMPEALDMLFSLGNDYALPLLSESLQQYHYAGQLAAMRQLVDSYTTDEWQATFYNSWVQSLRTLHAPPERSTAPLFTQTAAWQQEKWNTQLASWTQLRHDNVLYAKQSYTGMWTCSFPHSYIEPYPEFFRQLAVLAGNGRRMLGGQNYYGLEAYFSNLERVAGRLETLARKELAHEPFSAEECEFLQAMLYEKDDYAGPVYTGWYPGLLYGTDFLAFGEQNIMCVDVHTQPSDEFGTIVGRVLHTGIGRVNLGVFLVESPSNQFAAMAYVGPLLSYYEKVTENFKRMTDQEWEATVAAGDVPERPDWANIYLADAAGRQRSKGRELPAVLATSVAAGINTVPLELELSGNYPNPFNAGTWLRLQVPVSGQVMVSVHNTLGQRIRTLLEQTVAAGEHAIFWDGLDEQGEQVGSGVYLVRCQNDRFTRTQKVMLVK